MGDANDAWRRLTLGAGESRLYGILNSSESVNERAERLLANGIVIEQRSGEAYCYVEFNSHDRYLDRGDDCDNVRDAINIMADVVREYDQIKTRFAKSITDISKKRNTITASCSYMGPEGSYNLLNAESCREAESELTRTQSAIKNIFKKIDEVKNMFKRVLSEVFTKVN